MENWSLSKKIWAVIGVLSAAFVISSGFSIYGLVQGRSSIHEITQILVKRNSMTSEIGDNQRRLISLTMEITLRSDAEDLKRLNRDFTNLLKKNDSDIKNYLDVASPEGKALIAKYLESFEPFIEAMKTSLSTRAQGKSAEATAILFSVDAHRKQMRSILDDLNKMTADALENLGGQAGERAVVAIVISALISSLSILGSLVLAFFILRAVTRAIDEIVRSLSDSSIQVSGAATQIAASSEELSRATSEQAASLEETASSVEELNSMIARNSENARSTEETSNRSQHAVTEGKEVIKKMMEAMEAINQSSVGMAETVRVIEQIDKKTKVINEIVNKTELLSFNASVEAARAGEHGKGFAVVAEEVGNLARMSGAAAEEIASLLEESINKVNSMVHQTKENVEIGTKVAQDCEHVFEEVVTNVSSVSGMATEIASASQEQARGCGEISKAMTQLDQMTQQNAATSEECAASAEELSAQAEALRGAVTHLVLTVNGNQSHTVNGARPTGHGQGGTAYELNGANPGPVHGTQNVVQLKSPRAPKNRAGESHDSAPSKKVANGTPQYNSDGFKDV